LVLFGREKSPPRWKVCVNQVNSNLGMAVGAMFVRKYFDENSKEDTLVMTHELQHAFREIINETEWIDSQTKFLAELKLNAMSLKIGYPNFILDKEELNKKYKELEIHPDKYFENTLNVLRHMTRTEQMKLGQVVNKTVWSSAPAVVNAYYSRNKNQIMFPAGILQPPFYHRYFPKSLNFGGIGVVIGERKRVSNSRETNPSQLLSRSRTHPWLRRQRSTVRSRGQPTSLVERPRHRFVPRTCQMPDPTVRQLHRGRCGPKH
jgi:neprilysin